MSRASAKSSLTIALADVVNGDDVRVVEVGGGLGLGWRLSVPGARPQRIQRHDQRRAGKMRDAGKAILLVSVELDEIRSLADRVLVMFAGRVVGEERPDCPEQTLGLMMAGIAAGEAA